MKLMKLKQHEKEYILKGQDSFKTYTIYKMPEKRINTQISFLKGGKFQKSV